MSTAVLPTPAPAPPDSELEAFVVLMRRLRPGKSAVLDGVTWDEYVQFDGWRDELRPNVRLTYADGRLEIMAPSFFHDRISRRLCVTVAVLSAGLKIPALAGGTTRFHREALKKGLEPDECFYIQHIEAVRFLNELDLSIHPPPDLAVEVDHSSSSLPREPIYAALCVPESWRFDTDAVTFLIRQPDRTYQTREYSRAFPSVNSAELSRFVWSHTSLDEGQLIIQGLIWAQSLPPAPPASSN